MTTLHDLWCSATGGGPTQGKGYYPTVNGSGTPHWAYWDGDKWKKIAGSTGEVVDFMNCKCRSRQEAYMVVCIYCDQAEWVFDREPV